MQNTPTSRLHKVGTVKRDNDRKPNSWVCMMSMASIMGFTSTTIALSFLAGCQFSRLANHVPFIKVTDFPFLDIHRHSGSDTGIGPIQMDNTFESNLERYQNEDRKKNIVFYPKEIFPYHSNENENVSVTSSRGHSAIDLNDDGNAANMNAKIHEINRMDRHLFVSERTKFAELVLNMNINTERKEEVCLPLTSSSAHVPTSMSSRNDLFFEALIHPGMFLYNVNKPVSTDGARNVAIISSSSTSSSAANFGFAAVQEVLKHITVERVTLFGTVPECEDCSAANSDSRVELYERDSWKVWFGERFLPFPCNTLREKFHCEHNSYTTDQDEEGDKDDEEEEEENQNDEGDEDDEEVENHDEEDDDYEDEIDHNTYTFDIIIGDFLDTTSTNNPDLSIIDDPSLLEALYNSLTRNGIFVMPLGASPKLSQSDTGISDRVIDKIEKIGFESIHIYEEFCYEKKTPWSFLVACKSVTCRTDWYLNKVNRDFMIAWRVPSDPITSKSPLKHFDGATMQRYQNPPRVWEASFCSRKPMPSECFLFYGHNQRMISVSPDNFHVGTSSIGEGAGRGLFASRDIPIGSFVTMEHSDEQVFFEDLTSDYITNYSKRFPELLKVAIYMDGYGLEQEHVSKSGYYVYSAPGLFINHGCEAKTNNLVMILQPSSRLDVDPYKPKRKDDNSYYAIHDEPKVISSLYNPSLDRHLHSLMGTTVTSQNISAGDEMFIDYRWFSANSVFLAEYVEDLRSQCTGTSLGKITKGDMKDS